MAQKEQTRIIVNAQDGKVEQAQRKKQAKEILYIDRF